MKEVKIGYYRNREELIYIAAELPNSIESVYNFLGMSSFDDGESWCAEHWSRIMNHWQYLGTELPIEPEGGLEQLVEEQRKEDEEYDKFKIRNPEIVKNVRKLIHEVVDEMADEAVKNAVFNPDGSFSMAQMGTGARTARLPGKADDV